MDEKGIYTRINDLITEYIKLRCPNWSDGDIQWIVAGMWDAYNLGVGKIADFHKQVEEMQKTELVNKALFDYSKGLTEFEKRIVGDDPRYKCPSFAERQKQVNEAQAQFIGAIKGDRVVIYGDYSDPITTIPFDPETMEVLDDGRVVYKEPKPKKRGYEWL